jgi:hypothetical protein
MLRIAPKLAWSSLVAALVAGLSLAILACPSAAGQNSHAGPVTGVIDGVAFERDEYYVHGWACQEGDRGSIGVNIYANHPAGRTPPGTYVMAGTANLENNLPSSGSAVTSMAASTDSGSRCPTSF